MPRKSERIQNYQKVAAQLKDIEENKNKAEDLEEKSISNIEKMSSDSEKLVELHNLLVSMSDKFQEKLQDISKDFREQLSMTKTEINEDVKKKIEEIKEDPILRNAPF